MANTIDVNLRESEGLERSNEIKARTDNPLHGSTCVAYWLKHMVSCKIEDMSKQSNLSSDIVPTARTSICKCCLFKGDLKSS